MNVYEATIDFILSATTLRELEKIEATVDWLADQRELTPRQTVNLDKFLVQQHYLIELGAK